MARIDVDELRQALRLGKDCDECPRWGGNDCKGHLQWLCRRITRADERAKQPRGMYECFHCGTIGVVWGADFSFEDYGLEGEGIVHSCSCVNCGAEIEYYISLEDDDA